MQHKTLLALAAGIVLGGTATYFALPRSDVGRFAAVPVTAVPQTPKLSLAEAEVLREKRYESIGSVAETLALPTDFAETEALYALAGRSDSAEIQDLIYEAAGIPDRTDRRAALQILFLRLTELDPQSALAIARSPAFRFDRSVENDVWVAWGRLDLFAALREAETGSSAEKNRAAQALYVSARGLNNADSDLIFATLGILPGREAKVRNLHALADRSPAEAIRHIESLSSAAEQREHFGWLAHYLAQSGVGTTAGYAELIQSPAQRRIFEQSLATNHLRMDPQAAIERILDEPATRESMTRAYSALRGIAAQDPETAIELLDRLPADRGTERHKSSIIAIVARSDPELALSWIRENDIAGHQDLLAAVLGEIAHSDPQLAFSEAQAIESPLQRDRVITAVAMAMGQSNPAEALQMLAQIGDKQARDSGAAQLAAVWAQSDVNGAIAWVSTLDTEARRRAVQAMGQNLAYNDVDGAIALLDRFPDVDARELGVQIAESLARSRGVDAALAFAERYKGQRTYEQLQSAVIGMTASSDPERAMQMARNVADAETRDQLLAQLIGRQAASDPHQALQHLGTISHDESRGAAVAQIASAWYRRDAAAATAWIEGLPAGPARDNAIIAAISSGSDAGGAIIDLVGTIREPSMQKQAMLSLVRVMSRRDPGRAEQLLDDIDLSAEERQQLERRLFGRDYRHLD